MGLDKILCFGDSLTNGARDEYYRSFPLELSSIIRERTGKFYCCVNTGINGETTSHMYHRAHGVLAAHASARVVLFMGGTNDSKVPMPAEIYQDNVESIILMARAMGLKIYIGILPPVAGPGLPCYSQSGCNVTIQSYNDILRRICTKYGLGTCDFSGYGADMFCDGIHMNHKGYRQMALDWYDVIKEEIL